MNLLPREDLIRTSDVDHADWNYKPSVAWIMRKRFALVHSLLPAGRAGTLLEVGFGGGIFMPELAEHCENLFGIDVHEHVEEVAQTLRRNGVCAHLSRQDAVRTNFSNGTFDAIVAVSALEFIDDIEGAALELRRLLRSGGVFVAVIPGHSPLLDFLLRAFTGADAKHDYGDRRKRVVPVLAQRFRILRSAHFGPVYTAYAFGHSGSTRA